MAIGTQAVMAIHPLPLRRALPLGTPLGSARSSPPSAVALLRRTGGRGILAFSRKRGSKKVIPNRIEFVLFFLFSELVLQLFEHFENLG